MKFAPWLTALRLSAFALLFFAFTLAAQQPATLQLNSRLLSFALNVTDEHGAPVPNLTAADFELTEDDRHQRIAFFDQASTTPLDIVLAIDASESVAPYQHLERAAARTFLQSLSTAHARIALIAFADNVVELAAFTNNPRRIDAALGHIHHGHATALYDAVSFASRRLTDAGSAPNTRRVLVLITDGENTTHHGSYDSALEAAQRSGAMVYSLVLIPVTADAGRDTGGEHALMQLAVDTGGKSYSIAQQTDLSLALEHVSDDLRTQYALGYYQTAMTTSSPIRHIHLQLTNPALAARCTLRYRTSYYASAQP
jgi:Ca-activated chloride channel family protein